MTPKELIIKVVESVQGGKGPELVPVLIREFAASGLATDNIPILLQELVDENKLVEVEYVLPSLDFRLKSIYLPKGTKARLVNAQPLQGDNS